MTELKILELYSGIGGMHYAFLESGINGQIVASVDINTNANAVYRHNFPETPNWNRNIQNLKIEEITKLGVNAILMSPPCQPFTRVGLKKDSLDDRTASLFYVLKLIERMFSLKYVLVENVQGFENSDTRNELVSCLKRRNFKLKEFLLSPCQFGVPNSRKRYYLIAKNTHIPFFLNDETLSESIPEFIMDILPLNKHTVLAKRENKIDPRTGRKCYSLKNIIEEEVNTRFLIPVEILQKRWSVLDVRNADSNGSCCFTKAYSHYLEGTGSVYSPLSQEEIDDIFEQIKNVDKYNNDISNLLRKLKLRYFTPREVARFMCFPESLMWPDTITNKQQYKLLGNSLNVLVVSRLLWLLWSDDNFNKKD